MLKVPGIAEPLRLPVAGLRSLVILTQDEADAPVKDESTGRLEISRRAARGQAGGRECEGGARACLAWQPAASETASPMAQGCLGANHLQGAAAAAAAQPQMTQQRQSLMIQRQQIQIVSSERRPRTRAPGPWRRRFMNAMAEPDAPHPGRRAGEERRSLYLRDGDVIPSVVTKIDENGVWFRSSLSASTFVSNEKVKAVELAPDPTNGSPPPVRLTRTKQDRLLMLPRMQKTDPPTHLIRVEERRLSARSGDRHGRQDAEGRGAPREQGHSARPDLADHLAASPMSSTHPRSRNIRARRRGCRH